MKPTAVLLGSIALFITASVSAQESTGATAPVPPATDGCPAKSAPSPVYPMAAMRNNQRGTTVVSVALDACGRVIDARVAKGSGYKLLDDAAVDAVRPAVFGPTGAADKVVNGRLDIPVRFDITGADPRTPPPADPTPAQIGWPSTHGHPHYIADTSGEFASVAAAEKAVRSGTSRSFPVPYPGVGGAFLATGSEAHPEFWLLAELSQWNRIAVRYRPVMENGEPVVHVLLVCDDGPGRCARNQHVLMKGLPFAEAK